MGIAWYSHRMMPLISINDIPTISPQPHCTIPLLLHIKQHSQHGCLPGPTPLAARRVPCPITTQGDVQDNLLGQRMLSATASSQQTGLWFFDGLIFRGSGNLLAGISRGVPRWIWIIGSDQQHHLTVDLIFLTGILQSWLLMSNHHTPEN